MNRVTIPNGCITMVSVGEGYSQDFGVNSWVHKATILHHQLSIIMLEALSHNFCSGGPWEEIYADDLFIIADSLKKCGERLLAERSHGGEVLEHKKLFYWRDRQNIKKQNIENH